MDPKPLPTLQDVKLNIIDPKSEHKFWSKQPIAFTLNQNEQSHVNSAIKTSTPDQIQTKSYDLPPEYEWWNPDLNKDDQLMQIYSFLAKNYVEDTDQMFRFDYSPHFLRWALMPPGWQNHWSIGVRCKRNQILVGFVSAIPSPMVVYAKEVKMVMINFLCVHKKLRLKRLAPLLIREITRRVNLQNVWQACYTSGTILPNPVASCQYYHRSLNPKKLIEIEFSSLSPKMTITQLAKFYKLPLCPQIQGMRQLISGDIDQTRGILNRFLSQFNIYPYFSHEEFEHWFLPRDDVIYSYVVEKDGIVTDFISFYSLPSQVLKHPKHKTLKAAYSFYNVAGATPWEILMKDALILAKKAGFDVFNCLCIMDNECFLQPLKFVGGSGNLQYYFFNWQCPVTYPKGVGLVPM